METYEERHAKLAELLGKVSPASRMSAQIDELFDNENAQAEAKATAQAAEESIGLLEATMAVVAHATGKNDLERKAKLLEIKSTDADWLERDVRRRQARAVLAQLEAEHNRAERRFRALGYMYQLRTASIHFMAPATVGVQTKEGKNNEQPGK